MRRCWCDMELGRAINVHREDAYQREEAVTTLIAEAAAILPKGTVFEIRGKVVQDADDFAVAWYTNKRLQECAPQRVRIDDKLVTVPGELSARVPVFKAAVGGGGGFLLIARLEVT